MADYAISNVPRRVVYAASGTGPYAFTFEILSQTDIAVYKASTLLTLTTDYTVTINANGTGSVTLVTTAGTSNITIVGAKNIQRTTDFTTGGDLFANTLNDELDNQTIFIQQVAETAERGLKAPVVDPTDINMTLPAKASRVGTVLAFNATTGNPEAGPSIASVTTVAAQSANINTVATNIASVNTVAGNNTNINTVAGVSGNVTTVAGSIANVNTVADDLNEGVSEINTVAVNIADVNSVGTNISNVNTVAGISANVTSVAGNSSNINTVAGNNANVTTVAGISGNVTTVAGISANVTTVAGINAAVSTVATNNANVSTVATNIAAVNTNATNIVAIQNASTNATNAATSATAAQTAQSAAESARDATLAAYDNFDDRYLGSKTSNPTLDNDGNALAAGALYFNSVSGAMQVYTGSAWVAAYVSGTGFLASANNLSDVASTSSARTNLGLGTIATQAASSVAITGGSINGTTIGATTASTGRFSTLEATGVATVSAGSVSAPAITTTGDTNTGIFFPAADTIAFTEGGAESMRIDSAGNIGIGTTSPQSWGTGIPTIEFKGTSGAQPTRAGAVAFDSQSGSGGYNVISSIAGNLSFFAGTSNRASAAEAMRISSGGDVGIGTSTPSSGSKLTVAVNTTGATVPTDSLVAIVDSKDMALGDGGGIRMGGVFTTGSTANPDMTYIKAYKENATSGNFSYALTFGTRANGGNPTEQMRIDSSGNVGIGTTSPASQLEVKSAAATNSVVTINSTSTNVAQRINFSANGTIQAVLYNDSSQTILNSATAIPLIFRTTDTERMRITAGGAVFMGKSTAGIANTGLEYDQPGGALLITRSGANSLAINRLTNDGSLVEFFQDSTIEGSISVSGTTVSYNGGHLSRWSQLPDGSKDDTILKGTVMSNLDDMCVWTKDGEQLPNEQLNKMQVSDVEGDTNVAGVFVSWQFDEEAQSDDMNVAMTGDMIIRIADGVVVQKGDLLMSAGDGTAKPQGDDIVRSKTIAKVTSNYVTCTYADGSYCVPCVLMAC
jgi:hypothetical protein